MRDDDDGYLTLDQLQPCVDFASYCERVGPERHRYRIPGQHFILVERGRVDARAPDGRVTALRGDLLCLPAADLNEYDFDGAVRFVEAHIHFAPPPRHRRRVWLDGIGPLPLRVPLGSGLERMRRIFETFCCELPLPGAVHRARIAAAAWEMLGAIAEAVRPGETGAAPRLDVWQRSRMRLAGELGAKLEVRAVAAQARMSVGNFIRGFRRRFGASPGQYRAQQKLLLAAHRLRAADEPIKALARELGFADASSFARAFRRYLGVLPSELRAGRSGAAPPLPDRQLMPANQRIEPARPAIDISRETAPRAGRR